ncbi:hypothetical protein ACFU99_02730 [Streptomyces sp. NPDC057654]|uniref:hypothetical protein n=1 Tax=Streptomyces sp. NPDC057654 TaxID=3346196 RepID=UPI0036CF3E83
MTGSPEEAHTAENQWHTWGLALVRVGPAWDAVKLPSSLVHRVAGGHDRERVSAAFRRFGVTGPVFVERGTYVALVPPGTAAEWQAAAECVTTTAREMRYMGVPAPRPPGVSSHWVNPPAGAMCSASAVRALVEAGDAIGPHGAIQETGDDEEAGS